MKRIQTMLAIMLMGASLAAAAHEGSDHAGSKPGAVRKEQKDWGIAGDAKSAQRTIELTMSDHMRFTPDRLEVRQGETVKFVVRNAGQMFHEFVIGTRKELDEHAALMIKFPNMEHDEPYMAHVSPGKTGEVIWTFNRSGEFDFACLVPGHYQAGMTGNIKVIAANGGPPAGALEMTEGEVRKVDKDARKITLRHGPIKSLDMPAMTMVYRVSDPEMLEKVQPGDKVRFAAVDEGAGRMALTRIELVKQP